VRLHSRQVLAAAAAALLASGTAARAEEVVRASGTGSALGSLRRLGAAFEEAHPGHRLRVLPSVGSSGALQAVAQGALDVGVSGRALRPAERALGLAVTPYARTPLVFAVGPRTRATGITTGEVVRILRGELRRWSGGELLRMVMRSAGDVDTQLLRAVSAEMAAAVDLALSREGALVADTNQECNALIARTPGAVGLSSLTQILTEDRPVTALAWNGVAPTLANLASGAYPLAKPLFVVTRASPPPPVRHFLSFLKSPRARAILEASGSVPVLAPEE
jgi:phosphate transport system substrate-binding protein